MLLTLVSAILSIALAALALELPDASKYKFHVKLMFYFFAVLSVVIAGIQHHSDETDKDKLNTQLTSVKTQLATVTGELKQQHTDFGEAQNWYKEVIRALANSADPLDAALKQMSNQVDAANSNYIDPMQLSDLLKDEKAIMAQKRSESLMQFAPPANKLLSSFNGAIQTYATGAGYKLSKSYAEFPTDLKPNATDSFAIQVEGVPDWTFDCTLTYSSNSANVAINKHGANIDNQISLTLTTVTAMKDQILFTLSISGDTVVGGQWIPVSKFDETLRKAVGIALAEQVQQNPLTKR